MKITYYYLRHGRTVFNDENRMQGITDSPLTEEGIQMAQKAGKALSCVHFSAAYSSPSKRAQDTAAIVLKGRNLRAEILDDLHEFSYGDLDGCIKQECDPEYRRRFDHDLFDDVHGENREMISKRIIHAFDAIRSKSKDKDTVLIVGHGAYYRHLLRTLMQMDLEETDKNGNPLIPNGGIAVFCFDNGIYRLLKPAVSPEDFHP